MTPSTQHLLILNRITSSITQRHHVVYSKFFDPFFAAVVALRGCQQKDPPVSGTLASCFRYICAMINAIQTGIHHKGYQILAFFRRKQAFLFQWPQDRPGHFYFYITKTSCLHEGILPHRGLGRLVEIWKMKKNGSDTHTLWYHSRGGVPPKPHPHVSGVGYDLGGVGPCVVPCARALPPLSPHALPPGGKVSCVMGNLGMTWGV